MLKVHCMLSRYVKQLIMPNVNSIQGIKHSLENAQDLLFSMCDKWMALLRYGYVRFLQV